MKTIEDLIKWFENECTDGLIEPKEILFKMFELQSNINSNFENACKPLMRYLCENHHPHTKVIIDGNSSLMFEGIQCFNTNDFVID